MHGYYQVLQDEGFEEEHFWSNVKLVLLTAASAVALIAQFYPMPFPESRTLLATCCTLCVGAGVTAGTGVAWWPQRVLAWQLGVPCFRRRI